MGHWPMMHGVRQVRLSARKACRFVLGLVALTRMHQVGDCSVGVSETGFGTPKLWIKSWTGRLSPCLCHLYGVIHAFDSMFENEIWRFEIQLVQPDSD